MSDEKGNLPPGWEWATMAEVADYITSGARDWSGYYSNHGVLFIRTQDINTNRLILDNVARMNLPENIRSERTRVSEGDLLYTITGANVGKCALVEQLPEIGYPSQSIALVKLLDKSLGPWLHRCSIAHGFGQSQLDEMVYGLGRPVLNLDNIRDLRFPIAPLAEQQRIVSKIGELQERSRRAREALTEVGSLLEQFRQSVLAAAFRGDLTADWRAAHPDVEPASALLHRIRAERRCRWEQAELAKYNAKGTKPPKNWQDKYEELELVDASALPELPTGWVWTTWESILSLDDGSFKRGPFGSALKKSIFVSSGYKVYEQYCPINDDCSYVRYYITPEKYEELKAFAVKARDFLISCSGVTLGRITQVPDDFEEGVINQALLRVRINNEIVNDQFFLQLFRSPYFQKQIFDNATGSAIPNVKGVKDLKAIPVPVPPVAEQLEVLERLKERLDYTRGIEDGVKESSAAFDHLDQAIFAKAFRGELVPQNPNDEPASVLLERIRAQRAKQIEAAKPNKETAKTQRRDAMRKKSSTLSSQYQPLAEVLTTKGKPMSPEQLLTESGYDDDSVEDFYWVLREEIAKGRIRENRLTESDVTLEAVER